jgi:hypothetical protein
VKSPEALHSSRLVKVRASTALPEVAAGGSPHWVAAGVPSQAVIDTAAPAISVVRVRLRERFIFAWAWRGLTGSVMARLTTSCRRR